MRFTVVAIMSTLLVGVDWVSDIGELIYIYIYVYLFYPPVTLEGGRRGVQFSELSDRLDDWNE